MKRLIRQRRRDEIHLSDLIDRITNIIICDDVEKVPSALMSSTEVDDDDEQFFVSLSNEQLLEFTQDEIHAFSNLELLDRIYHLAPYRLSKDQIQSLRAWYKKKVIIDKKDVRDLLELLKQCSHISYQNLHKKTNQFAADDEGMLRESDCLEIIHQLEVSDYVANSRSINANHFGNNIIIFQPEADWETSEGEIIEDLVIYIKLDIDETTKHAVALISFHPADYVDSHPYAQ